MKLKRFVTKRRMKWVGVIASLLTATLWIGFAFAVYVSYWATATHEMVAGIGDGRVFLLSVERRPPQDLFLATEVTQGFRVTSGFSMQLSFAFGNLMGSGFGKIALPLWFPLLLVAAPTVYLWRADRVKPWQCRKCRYDLRGLEGGGDEGVCPECGQATRSV